VSLLAVQVGERPLPTNLMPEATQWWLYGTSASLALLVSNEILRYHLTKLARQDDEVQLRKWLKSLERNSVDPSP
jgi:hypothetical protein